MQNYKNNFFEVFQNQWYLTVGVGGSFHICWALEALTWAGAEVGEEAVGVVGQEQPRMPPSLVPPAAHG